MSLHRNPMSSMQCTKCGKRFPLSVTQCDKCGGKLMLHEYKEPQ
jgi:rRNA maturation endonuclease Nob1